MANKVTMSICGQEYTLVADESAEYMSIPWWTSEWTGSRRPCM